MEKFIAIAIPALFIVGIIWLIVASNKRINKALSTASKTLGQRFDQEQTSSPPSVYPRGILGFNRISR